MVSAARLQDWRPQALQSWAGHGGHPAGGSPCHPSNGCCVAAGDLRRKGSDEQHGDCRLVESSVHEHLCRALRQALKPGLTRLVMLESPTNPRMQICDIKRLTELAHEVRRHTLPAHLPTSRLLDSHAAKEWFSMDELIL